MKTLLKKVLVTSACLLQLCSITQPPVIAAVAALPVVATLVTPVGAVDAMSGAKKVATVEVAGDGKVEERKGSGVDAVEELPTFFIAHGGGPSFFLKPRDVGPFADVGPGSKMERGLATFAAGLKPKALLVITAHWEASTVTVSGGSSAKELLYDYGGFPRYTYNLKWPAPRAPQLTKRVRQLLTAAGIANKEDTDRGFDHGVFIPMKVAFPDATIPTVAISLRSDLHPKFHLQLGQALRPLRREGVLIVASGFSYHGMSAPLAESKKVHGCAAFDGWLHSTLQQASPKREEGLQAWAKAPGARVSHPREEHLLPLHVAAGAAMGDKVTRIYNERNFGDFLTSMFRFDASSTKGTK